MSEYVPVPLSLDRHAARLCDCCRTLPASVPVSDLEPPEAPSLGIYAESSSLEDQTLKIDPKTGEILGEGWSYAAALAERYALQAQARRAMLEAHRRDGKQGKPHKVTRCRRWLRPRSKIDPGYAEVFRHAETGRTHFGGLEVCGSSWACPVCAVKIAERRAEEIRKAVEQWMASGGICFFITLTVPHDRADALGGMVQGFRKALDRFRAGAGARSLRSMMGYAGMIRALEVTWGEANGWHPHSHEIWFCRQPRGFPLYDLIQRWQDCAEAAGFRRPSDEHGFNFKVCQTAAEAQERLAEYLTKLGREKEDVRPLWGPAEELTRAHSKKGRGQRFTPWDFLRAQYDPEVSSKERVRYRALFAEYVAQFKGLAQVFWSRGLKARFDLAERTDEELADEAQEPADLLARIEPEDWQKVIYRQDHRATLLLLAQGGGADAIREFLDSLPLPPPGPGLLQVQRE